MIAHINLDLLLLVFQVTPKQLNFTPKAKKAKTEPRPEKPGKKSADSGKPKTPASAAPGVSGSCAVSLGCCQALSLSSAS